MLVVTGSEKPRLQEVERQLDRVMRSEATEQDSPRSLNSLLSSKGVTRLAGGSSEESEMNSEHFLPDPPDMLQGTRSQKYSSAVPGASFGS